ncbi:hypothetical protein E2C01_006716 [Portunus trituberculatus]|uniref:Uncharacterized protein n=1 Tax=Portunus trituberculatus TaxID=210409 RepID=A0A5B7D2J9_PORTR|nr:hypothetical protein [Portunus trituberculatus]
MFTYNFSHLQWVEENKYEPHRRKHSPLPLSSSFSLPRGKHTGTYLSTGRGDEKHPPDRCQSRK